MTPFQWVALPLLALLWLRTAHKLWRTTGRRRWQIAALLAWSGALIAVAHAEWTTTLSQRLGIGRGADLLIYLVALGLLVAAFHVAARFDRVEGDVTRLVRELALERARQRYGVPDLPPVQVLPADPPPSS